MEREGKFNDALWCLFLGNENKERKLQFRLLQAGFALLQCSGQTASSLALLGLGPAADLPQTRLSST